MRSYIALILFFGSISVMANLDKVTISAKLIANENGQLTIEYRGRKKKVSSAFLPDAKKSLTGQEIKLRIPASVFEELVRD